MTTPGPPRAPKIQRWIDLTAALLRHRYGISFEELSRDVPAYAECASHDARMRMFERDKDELRRFGVTIEAVPDDDGVPSSYVLRRKEFYLPYLLATSGRTGSIPARGRSRAPAREMPKEKAGYRDLPRLALEPDELSAVADAAARVRQLGDPLLAADAESALRKLAFDLPVGALVSTALPAVVPGRSRADARVFEQLDRALRNRKRASFSYRAPGREGAERREVEPYGLFFVGGHWYLAARDATRDALRNFRLDRIARVEVNARREQSADYGIPPSFDLREHAASRQAWELGDGEAIDAVVTFAITDGATAAASRLGAAAGAEEQTRRFRVRRMPPFVRWLVSFGGDAMPVDPPALVDAFRSCVRATLARYARPDDALKAGDPARQDDARQAARIRGRGATRGKGS